jgi:hypothetical protein
MHPYSHGNVSIHWIKIDAPPHLARRQFLYFFSSSSLKDDVDQFLGDVNDLTWRFTVQLFLNSIAGERLSLGLLFGYATDTTIRSRNFPFT